MNFVRQAIGQPVTIAVGVILILMAGVLALRRIPIQLTPNVESTIITVSTFWEGASPEEVEQNIVDKQEERLLGLANLRQITSTSGQSLGHIRLADSIAQRLPIQENLEAAVATRLQTQIESGEHLDDGLLVIRIDALAQDLEAERPVHGARLQIRDSESPRQPTGNGRLPDPRGSVNRDNHDLVLTGRFLRTPRRLAPRRRPLPSNVFTSSSCNSRKLPAVNRRSDTGPMAMRRKRVTG